MISDQVMHMPEPTVQRTCARCEEEEKNLHRKENGTLNSSSIAPPIVHNVLAGSGRPLDPVARSFMEPRFGRDFADVRIHTVERAAESADAVNARAYTVGRDVVFAEGEYRPETEAGRRLIAHELWHVVQGQAGAGQQLARQKKDESVLTSDISNPKKIRIWINTFIPMDRVDMAGFGEGDIWESGIRCFAGDGREFSNDIKASYRTQQVIEFDTGTLEKTMDTLDTGETHLQECWTGITILSKKAPTNGIITTGPERIGDNLLKLNFTVDASNPLLPLIAPAINLSLSIYIILNNRTAIIIGEHDGFPAYEIYISSDGGTGQALYTYDPRTEGNSPTALFPPMEIKVPGKSQSF